MYKRKPMFADWGYGETRANKVIKALQIKCPVCGKGFSIFEPRLKYHKKCKIKVGG